MKKLSLFLLPFLLLSACQPLGPTLPAGTAPPPTITVLTSQPPAATATAILIKPTDAPAATQAATSNAPQTATFSDCALVPALASCGGKLPLGGVLAINDLAGKRLVVVDFKTGAAWQAPAPAAPSALSFSPSGKLLAALPPADSGKPDLIYNTGSGSETQLVLPPQGSIAWTPKDSLEAPPFRTAWSAAGDQAYIDTGTGLAHVRLAAADKEVIWPVAQAPGDQIAQAVTWVPGSDLLLFEQHYAGNSMWVTGGALSTLNVKTGEIKDLKANMLLNFKYQWHPTEPGVLVIGDSSNSPVMGGQNLAVLNVLTGEIAHPIADANVSASAPAWLPDGKTILFAASMAGDAAQPGDPFASPAIYVINRDGSNPRALTKPAQNGRDDQPQLLPDGTHFLYFRTDTQKSTITLRLAALDGALDEAVTGPLAPAACPYACGWGTIADYKP